MPREWWHTWRCYLCARHFLTVPACARRDCVCRDRPLGPEDPQLMFGGIEAQRRAHARAVGAKYVG